MPQIIDIGDRQSAIIQFGDRRLREPVQSRSKKPGDRSRLDAATLKLVQCAKKIASSPVKSITAVFKDKDCNTFDPDFDLLAPPLSWKKKS